MYFTLWGDDLLHSQRSFTKRELRCFYTTQIRMDWWGEHIFTPFLLTNSRSITRHRLFLPSGGYLLSQQQQMPSGVSPGWDGRSWRCQCQLSSTQDGPPGRRYRPRCIWRLAPWNQSQPQLFYRGQPRWNLGTADTLTGPHLEQNQTEQMVGMDRQICRYVWGCGSVLPGQKLSWHMALTEGMWFGRT